MPIFTAVLRRMRGDAERIGVKAEADPRARAAMTEGNVMVRSCKGRVRVTRERSRGVEACVRGSARTVRGDLNLVDLV